MTNQAYEDVYNEIFEYLQTPYGDKESVNDRAKKMTEKVLLHTHIEHWESESLEWAKRAGEAYGEYEKYRQIAEQLVKGCKTLSEFVPLRERARALLTKEIKP